jgi:hypothetical protein
MTAKRPGRLPDIGVSMDGKDNRGIGSVCNASRRATDAGNPTVKAFAAMTRHQDQSPALEMGAQHDRKVETQLRPFIDQVSNPQQSIDPSIPGHEDPAAIDALPSQIRARPCGRGETQIGNVADQSAVHLFGPRRMNVIGAQTGLDMRYQDSVVEGCQSPTNVVVASP